MTMQIGQVTETQAVPRVETIPSITYGFVDLFVPIAGNIEILKGTNVFATSADWCIGARDELSFQLEGEVLGMVMECQISFDGLLFRHYHAWTIPITPNGTWISGFILPAFMARFILYNPDPAVARAVAGLIMLRGK